MFTHHAKTFPNLILALRNSLLKTGVFTNEKVAELQVVQVINFDIHLKRGYDGSRFIERITECVPIEQKNPYKFDFQNEGSMDAKWEKFMNNATHYFQKVTEVETYNGINILEYHDGQYFIVNRISDHNIDEMRDNMSPEDQKLFDEFLDTYMSRAQFGQKESKEQNFNAASGRKIVID